MIDEVRREEWRKAKWQYKDVIMGQRYNLFLKLRQESLETDQRE